MKDISDLFGHSRSHISSRIIKKYMRKTFITPLLCSVTAQTNDLSHISSYKKFLYKFTLRL